MPEDRTTDKHSLTEKTFYLCPSVLICGFIVLAMASSRITSVGIVVKPNHAEARRTAGELATWLSEHGVRTCDEPFEAGQPLSEAALAADLIVVLGGDGTMISTARMAGGSDVLVLGINYGSLGYLTEFRIEEMFPALEAIIAGEYELDPRAMLEVELLRVRTVAMAQQTLDQLPQLLVLGLPFRHHVLQHLLQDSRIARQCREIDLHNTVMLTRAVASLPMTPA